MSSAVLAIVLAACSGSSTTSPAPTLASAPTSTAAASTAGASTAPLPSASLPAASATASFGGGVAGVAPGVLVDCDSPSLTGLTITLYGPTTTKALYTTITIASGYVAVTLDAGSGAAYTSRSSSGTGVSGFDAAKGVQIDSPLPEMTSTAKRGSVPAISSIKASIDCGNQVPGSSTL